MRKERVLVKTNFGKIFDIWEYIFILSMFLITVYFFKAGISLSGLFDFSLERVGLSIISVILFVGILIEHKKILEKIKDKKFLLGWVLLGELVFALVHNNFFSYKKLFIDTSLILIFLISIPHSSDQKYFKYLTWLLIAIILYLALPVGFPRAILWHEDGTYKGAFIHRNALGYFMVPVAIWFLTERIKRIWKIAFFIVYFLLIFFVSSRSFIISSTLVFFTYFILTKKNYRLAIASFILHVLIWLSWKIPIAIFPRKIIYSICPDKIDDYVKVNTRVFETSTTERWSVLVQGVFEYLKNPIFGIGKIFLADSPYTKKLDMNNFYLSHLISYGIFPTIFIFVVFFWFYKSSGIRVRLILINLFVFAMFQAFFDYFQSAFFFASVLLIYCFNYFDLRNTQKIVVNEID